MIEGQARRSGVFLLELMISILFFCIAAAVGLQLFVKSHCISEDAGNMNMAVHRLQRQQKYSAPEQIWKII